MKIARLNSRTTTFWSVIFCLFVIFSATAQEEIQKTKNTTTINGVKYYLHTIEKGQTLFNIAKVYDIPVGDIVLDNPESIDGIKPGKILKIQQKKKATEVTTIDTALFVIHKVEKGQTLYSITKKYNVSTEALRSLNPELKDGLKEGQVLKIAEKKSKTEVKNTTTTATINAPKINKKIQEKEQTNSEIVTEKKAITPTVNYTGEKKDEYNIAFFLPFKANEANTIPTEDIISGTASLSNKSTIALQFYEGALLAIDSLKKEHLRANVFVFDVDDSDSLTILKTLKKPELGAMDLIVGPLYGSEFMPVATFAKEHHIPIVSPFTQVNKILFNNPYVSKVSPSTTLQIEQMAHFVIDSFKTQQIILVNNNNIKEAPFFNAFKNTANAALLKNGASKNDSIKEVTGAGLEKALSVNKTNIIIVPSNNQSYVTELISKLNTMTDRYKIVLFGLQSWMNYDNLDFEYLNKLNLHIPSNLFVDYENISTQTLIKKYREEYKTEPSDYTFQGFDVTYAFISLLNKNGSGFLKNLTSNSYKGVSSTYQFSQFPTDSGFENKFVHILKYQDYKLKKAN